MLAAKGPLRLGVRVCVCVCVGSEHRECACVSCSAPQNVKDSKERLIYIDEIEDGRAREGEIWEGEKAERVRGGEVGGRVE